MPFHETAHRPCWAPMSEVKTKALSHRQSTLLNSCRAALMGPLPRLGPPLSPFAPTARQRLNVSSASARPTPRVEWPLLHQASLANLVAAATERSAVGS